MDAGASLLGDGEIPRSPKQHVAVDESGSQRVPRVVPIPIPAGGAFRQDEIMHLQAPGDRGVTRSCPGRDLPLYEPLPPAAGSPCRLRPNSVRVVAERPMELRAVAESTVDQVRCARVMQGIDVRLERLQQRFRRRLVGAKNRLASDDDELALPRDRGRRSDDVLELVDAQLHHLAQDPLALRLA